MKDWLEGDPAQPPPPATRRSGRNAEWKYLYNRDVLSMPDTWEYPWYAAWDLAFHMLPFARIDPHFAKEQLVLLLREWYMRPNGQIPAYEWAFGDVNPPVHAWAAWRVYKLDRAQGERDRRLPERVFQKLLHQLHLVGEPQGPRGQATSSRAASSGSTTSACSTARRRCRTGGYLEQADGTAWMAFYCGTMLSIALELASEDPAYEDVASSSSSTTSPSPTP